MRRPALLLVALMALLPLAACGDDGDAGADTDATTAPAEDPVAGRTFESTEVEGTAPPLVDGAPIRISFAEDEITIEAGCDPITGSYEVDGPILEVEDLTGTESGCTPGLIPQNEWISDMIVTRPVITLAPPDGLVLSDEAWTLTMVEGGAEDATLVGPTWTIEALVGQDPGPVPEDVTASILFSDDGRYEVFAGCNTGSGTYTPPGGGATIEVEPPTLTRERCDEEKLRIESLVVATLDGSVEVALEGDQLTLVNAEGTGLAFTSD